MYSCIFKNSVLLLESLIKAENYYSKLNILRPWFYKSLNHIKNQRFCRPLSRFSIGFRRLGRRFLMYLLCSLLTYAHLSQLPTVLRWNTNQIQTSVLCETSVFSETSIPYWTFTSCWTSIPCETSSFDTSVPSETHLLNIFSVCIPGNTYSQWSTSVEHPFHTYPMKHPFPLKHLHPLNICSLLNTFPFHTWPLKPHSIISHILHLP